MSRCATTGWSANDRSCRAFRSGRSGLRRLPPRQLSDETMISADQARQLALALPEAVEQDHHGRPSFRVTGKIFATLWDETHINVMLDEPGILTAVESDPIVCSEFWWGKRLGAVHVNLNRAGQALLGELLADAWERKAPKRLLSGRTRPKDPAG